MIEFYQNLDISSSIFGFICGLLSIPTIKFGFKIGEKLGERFLNKFAKRGKSE